MSAANMGDTDVAVEEVLLYDDADEESKAVISTIPSTSADGAAGEEEGG